MAFLHLPLSLSSTGIFERATTEENIVGSRLRLFILSGAGEYIKLPSPGIRTLWIHFYNMGTSGRFCEILEEDKRRSLEKIIKDEVNNWFSDTIEIKEVEILGNEETDNGIKFQTSDKEFIFTFKLAQSSKGLKSGTIGPWNIIEEIHDL